MRAVPFIFALLPSFCYDNDAYMLRRIFGNIIPGIDRLIERIPPHIRDIIQKASLAFAALVALLVIIAGINKGLSDAKPKGFKLVEHNRDLFYLQEMREEYAKKRKLVEDVEVDPLQFPSRQKAQDDTKFAAMGRDTMGHLMGEKEEMLKHEDVMRPKEKSPGYLGDNYQIPRLAPDKKATEDDEAHLTRDKIGSQKPAAEIPAAPAVGTAKVAPAIETSARPSRAENKPGRDVFDETPAARPSAPATPSKNAAPAKPRGKFEFID